MGSITRTAIRSTAVDFSYPYFVTSIGLLSKKPGPLPKYGAVLWPFQTELWMGLGTDPIWPISYSVRIRKKMFKGIALIACCPINWLFARPRPGGLDPDVSLGYASWQVLATLLTQGNNFTLWHSTINIYA